MIDDEKLKHEDEERLLAVELASFASEDQRERTQSMDGLSARSNKSCNSSNESEDQGEDETQPMIKSV